MFRSQVSFTFNIAVIHSPCLLQRISENIIIHGHFMLDIKIRLHVIFYIIFAEILTFNEINYFTYKLC
jgi:hypothetical protein